MNTAIHDWKQEFILLQKHAEALHSTNPDAEQVIVLRTANGNLYSVVNRNITGGDHRDEDICLQTLREKDDTQVFSILALWDTHSPEITSAHFNQGLVDLNPENENARIFLQGRDCIMAKRLKVALPPRGEQPELQREYIALRVEAEKILEANPAAEGIIVLRTVKDKLYSVTIQTDDQENHQAEDICLKQLAEHADTEVYSVLTLWNNGTTDFAPSYFLQALNKLNPINKRANIFRHVFVVELEDVLPPKFDLG